MLSYFGDDLSAEFGSSIEHGHHNASDLEALVRARISNLLDDPDYFDQALEREVLALNRNKHAASCDQRVNGENVQRGWTINKDEIVAVEERLDRGFEPLVAVDILRELDGDTDEFATCRSNDETLQLRRL